MSTTSGADPIDDESSDDSEWATIATRSIIGLQPCSIAQSPIDEERVGELSSGTGMMIWWSTNTRSAAVLSYLAALNGIPLCIVLDPDAVPPGPSIRSRSSIVERSRLPLDTAELIMLTQQARKTLGVSDIVLCPTSEYLQTVVFSVQNSPSDLTLLPASSIPYRELTSKEWLNRNGSNWGVPTPKSFLDVGSAPRGSFVAKPRQNVKENITLKPFLVADSTSRQRFFSEQHLWYAEELITASSDYWCAYRSSGGEISSYFQRNLLQEPGGGSIAYARRRTGWSLSKATRTCAAAISDFLDAIQYRGPIMAEIRAGLVTEINPRFWGPLLLDATGRGVVVGGFFSDCFGIEVDIDLPKSRGYVAPSLLGGSIRCREAIRPEADGSSTLQLLRGIAWQHSRPLRKIWTQLGGDF